MKDRRPWFKFWHEDFWHSERVRVMSAEGVALYLLLLTEQWSQGPLLDDPEFWRKVHGGRFARFEEAWDEVRPCFELEGDRLVSPRLERERQEAEELLARRREAGSRGGKAKAQKAASRPQERGSSSKRLASARATPSKHLPIEKEKEIEKESKKNSPSGSAEGGRAVDVSLYESPPWAEYGLNPQRLHPIWASWIKCKKRRSAGPYQVGTMRRMLKRMQAMGTEQVARMLENADQGGYQGLVWDKFEGAKGRQRGGTPTGMDALKQVIAEDYENGRRLNRGTRPRRVSRRSIPGVESDRGDVPGLPRGASRPPAGGGDGRLPLMGPGS